MQLHTKTLNALADCLQRERLAQNLSREQLAAVCNVSTSFIRDAERNPGRCSLELMLQLIQGLGLSTVITGWQTDAQSDLPGNPMGDDADQGAPK